MLLADELGAALDPYDLRTEGSANLGTGGANVTIADDRHGLLGTILDWNLVPFLLLLLLHKSAHMF